MSSGFFFNFCVETGNGEKDEKPAECLGSVVPTPQEDKTKASDEVNLQTWHKDVVSRLKSSPCICSVPVSDIDLKYVDSASMPPNLLNVGKEFPPEAGLSSLLELCNSSHSDLIPGTYEGGLKAWECAFDLVRFLSETGVDFSGKSVLELGCGVGLPGIYSMMTGADRVHFQDYNSEVLQFVTIPSLLLNVGEKPVGEKCRFYSGDWSNLASVCSGQYYDIILTSETIYSLASQPCLLSVLKERRRPCTGVVYVAAKSVYFGVGGTVAGFCKMVEEDGSFLVEKVWRSERGVSRVILKLSCKTVET